MKNKSIIWITALIIIVVISALAVYFLLKQRSPTIDSYIYTGPEGTYEVLNTKEGGVDITYIKIYVHKQNATTKISIPLRFDPLSVENIPLEPVKDKVLSKQLIYLTQDSELPDLTNKGSIIASLEISKITGLGIYKIPTQTGISKPFETSKLPVITCDAVNETTAVINFRFGNPSISLENDCIIIKGSDKDSIIKAADKFVMHLFGVF